MALTLSDIKKYLLGFLCLTSYANVDANRLVLNKHNLFGYLPTKGIYGYYGIPSVGGYDISPLPCPTPSPSLGYYDTPSFGGYYYISPSPSPPSPSPVPPIPKKTKKSKNNLALGLGSGLGLGVPVIASGIAYWIYKHRQCCRGCGDHCKE